MRGVSDGLREPRAPVDIVADRIPFADNLSLLAGSAEFPARSGCMAPAPPVFLMRSFSISFSEIDI